VPVNITLQEHCIPMMNQKESVIAQKVDQCLSGALCACRRLPEGVRSAIVPSRPW